MLIAPYVCYNKIIISIMDSNMLTDNFKKNSLYLYDRAKILTVHFLQYNFKTKYF
jgi:hypothetical protein